MGEQRGVRVHVYNTTRYAYDETQTNEDIHDGDVIVAEDERAVAILDQAWPFAVTVEHGEFHGPPVRSAHLVRDGDFAASLAVALDEARKRGFAVSPLNAPVVTSPGETGLPLEREKVCPSCDGWGQVEVCHPSTDALLYWAKCPDESYHPVSLVKYKPQRVPVTHMEGCDGVTVVRDECCPPF